MSQRFFSLQATDAYAGVQLSKLLFSVLSLFVYGIVFASVTHIALLADEIALVWVGGIVVLGLLGIAWLFIRQELTQDSPVADSVNIAEYLSAELVRLLVDLGGDAEDHLLEAAAKTQRGEFMLREMGIDTQTFLQRFEVEAHAPIDLLPFLEQTLSLCTELGDARIDGSAVLGLFFQTDDHAQSLLNELDLSQEDVRRILRWERFHRSWEERTKRWNPQRIARTFGTIGRKWVLGYTKELDAFSTDVSEEAQHKSTEVIIHQREISDVLRILARSQRKNVLLLGRPGVGKKTLVWNLASILRKHEMEHSLKYTRMLLLHTEQLLAGAQHPEKLLLQSLSRASKAGKFILVIDNLALLLRSDKREVISVLSKFLHDPNISLLGIADAQEYHTLVKQDVSFDQLFEKVLLDNASTDETTAVLMVESFKLMERKSIAVSYRALKQTLELCERYIAREGFPGKAVAVIEDAVARAASEGSATVTEDHVRAVVSLHAHVDVTNASQEDRDRLLQLESQLQARIIGQNQAIASLSNALKRARMDIHESKRPIGTFLFLGPTGVGKTETAKSLAELYFGSQDALIRLDMNEYSTADSVHQLVGSGGAQEGHLSQRVQDVPFSVVLLDEIEKAHQSVLNVFLQILDEGHLIDGAGMKTDFRNTIIIATSNAGAHFVREFAGKQQDMQQSGFKKLLIDTILKEKIFSPEFVNRFDEIILFSPLSLQNAKRVGMLMIDSIIHEMQEKRGIHVHMEEGAVNAVVERGYSAEFGAREMRRAIVDTVETFLADTILRQDVKRGDTITIRAEDVR